VDEDMLRALRSAVSAVARVRAACLVERRVTLTGLDSGFRLGIAAHLRTRRFRDTSRDLRNALEPFGPPRDKPAQPLNRPVIFWMSFGNSAIDEEIWSCGIPISPPPLTPKRRRGLWCHS